MHKVHTPWPVATRVQYMVAFDECGCRWPRLSARRFCSVAEVPYPTFARWWALWRRQGKYALLDRSRQARRRAKEPQAGLGAPSVNRTSTGSGAAALVEVLEV